MLPSTAQEAVGPIRPDLNLRADQSSGGFSRGLRMKRPLLHRIYGLDRKSVGARQFPHLRLGY